MTATNTAKQEVDFRFVVDAMFSNKRLWQQLTDEDKEKFFFIFNRYVAKRYPREAQLFNRKGVCKASAMDLWFATFRRETRPPGWFWAGAKVSKPKKKASDNDAEALADYYGTRQQDAELLCRLYPEDARADVLRIEKMRKEQEK